MFAWPLLAVTISAWRQKVAARTAVKQVWTDGYSRGMDAATAGALLRTAEDARLKMRGFDSVAAVGEVELQYPDMLVALD